MQARAAARIIMKGVTMLVLSGGGLAQEAPKEAPKVQVSFEQLRLGRTFTLTMVPRVREGFKLNLDGPWQLTFSNCQGIQLAETKVKKERFASPSGQVVLKGVFKKTQKKKNINENSCEYVLEAFSCTELKQQCFREQLQGRVVVKSS